jgi:hypothetical protein
VAARPAARLPQSSGTRALNHAYASAPRSDAGQAVIRLGAGARTHGGRYERRIFHGAPSCIRAANAPLAPHERFVLPGVSRATVIELAAKFDISCREADIDLYDACNADEVFPTSTSLCICPVRSVNGSKIGDGGVPGPITRRLTEAYIELVDCDFVAQYLKQLG